MIGDNLFMNIKIIVARYSFLFCLLFLVSCESRSYNKSQPHRAENGDFRGKDNDYDGRKEPIFVKGYTKKNGTKVRSHYRAKPKKKN